MVIEESIDQSICNKADVKPGYITLLAPNLGNAIAQTSSGDGPPCAPKAQNLQSGEILISSTQYVDYLLGILVNFVAPLSLISNVFASSK